MEPAKGNHQNLTQPLYPGGQPQPIYQPPMVGQQPMPAQPMNPQIGVPGNQGAPVIPMQGYVMTPMGYLAPTYYKGKRKPEKNLPGTFDKFNGGFLSDLLEDIRGIFIRERTDWVQALTGCTQETHFCVQNLDAKNGAILLRCQENSDCCHRQCLSGSCRPFAIDITNCFDGTLSMRIEREFSCTCLCLNRPIAKMYVYDDNNAKHYIGMIEHVFKCCEYVFQITDHYNQFVYDVKTPLCQKAIICQCPCQECNVVDFTVHNTQGEVVSHCRKEGKGCIKNALTQADNFNVLYTPIMPWNHRALLLGSILFLNFRMFEDKHKNNNDNNNRR